MNENDNLEMRRYIRIGEELDVRLKVKDDDNFNINQVRSVDVSAGGMLIRYNRPMKIGKIINVCFLRPNSFDFLESNARVARNKLNPDDGTYEIGIDFVDFSEDDKEKFSSFLMHKPNA